MRNRALMKISCEFFPPKTPEGADKLLAHAQVLGTLNPEYFSVTFGAGGSTQQGTLDTVLQLRDLGFEAAPHLSCVGQTRAGLREIILRYQASGIRRIVALRGDLPSGAGSFGDFRYANELVQFIRETAGDTIRIKVAAYPEFHPQARTAQDDIANFVRKVEAGADEAVTQYFYNADAYFRFVDAVSKLGVNIPIVPGIMPIGNYSQLKRFSDGCGAEIPRWLDWQLRSYGDDINAIKSYGLDVVTSMCQQLLKGGAPGLHFYTMNQSAAIVEIVRRLRD